MQNFEAYADAIMKLRYSHVVEGREETWDQIALRASRELTKGIRLPSDVKSSIYEAIRDRKLIPGGRILSQAGREYHQTDNCFTLRAEDTREGWADLAQKCTMMFMSGGGIGIDYSQIRPYGSELKRSGGISSGPVPLVEMINSIAKAVRQGGERRGACYASLNWDHPDILQFIEMKKDPSYLQHTNISVQFDKHWLSHIQGEHGQANDFYAHSVFNETLKHACKYGDPGFQFDWDSQTLRNACTETISEDDSDSCCLGSLNFAEISNPQEVAEITELGIILLLCNTLYTHKPTEEVKRIKEKNRRLGLGIMGLGEWFIQRKMNYGEINDELRLWLSAYRDNSSYQAKQWSNYLSISNPVATRAIAPTGTISIVGGRTTPGIEPVFHTCYERTYNTLKTQDQSLGYRKEIVIDPIVQKWIENGYNVRDIDTAYSLSSSLEGIENRLKFQAFVQQFVDNGISSTVNLPSYKEGIEESISPVLLKYLPSLRGVTFYPDDRHENQPVRPLELVQVLKHKGYSLGEYDSCKGGVCGL